MKKFALLAFAVAAIQLTGCTSGGVDTPPPTGSGGQSNFSFSNSSSTDVGNLNDGPGQSLSSEAVASSSVATGGSEVPLGDVVTGKALFDSPVYGCVDCHGVFGESMGDSFHYPIDPDKEVFEVEAEEGQSKQQMNLVKYIKDNMPPEGYGYEQCSDNCASNVAAYIKSWKKKGPNSSADASESSVAVSSEAESSVAPSSQSSEASSVPPVVVSSSSQAQSSQAQSSAVSTVSSVASSEPVASSSSQQSQVASSSEPVASSSSAESSSSEPAEVVEGDADNGKLLYEGSALNCIACHGATGENQRYPIDATKDYFTKTGNDAQYTLAEYINNFMPRPGACDTDCSIDIAAYIKTWVEDSSSSEASESSSSSEDVSSSSSSSIAQSSEAQQSSSSEAASESSEASISSADSSVAVSDPASSSEDAQSSQAYVGDAAAGKLIYEGSDQLCSLCHGDDGQNPAYKVIDPSREFYNHSMTSGDFTLADYIEEFMPPSGIGSACDATCAADVAAYIRTWAEDESSSSSEGSTSSSEASSSSSVTAETVSGLDYYFSMDQGAGAVLPDVLGNSDDGDINGASWVSGAEGSGLEFGLSDHVNFTSMDVDASSITISAWIKPYSEGENREGRIISKADGLNEDDHIWMLSFGKKSDDSVYLRFRLRTDLHDTKTIWTSADAVQMNVWQHVAVTYDGDELFIYVNGNQVGSSSDLIGDVASDPNMPVAIGGHPGGGRGFDGVIDEVRIYSRSLDQADVQSEYAGLYDQISDSGSTGGSGGTGGGDSGGSVEPEPEPVPDEIIPITEGEFKPKYSCSNPDARGSSQDIYRRLSYQELLNALTTLFGESLMATVETEKSLLPEETHGFKAEVFASSLTSSHLNAINSMAGKLATGAVEDSSFIQRYTECNSLDSEACVEQLIENFGSRALRRPLAQEEIDSYLSQYLNDAEVSVATLIHAFLLDVEFNIMVEGGSLQGDRYRLDSFEIASRLSFRTTANIPDDELWQAALNRELQTLDQIRQQAARLFATDLGKKYIRSFFRNWVEIEDSIELSVTDAYRNGIDTESLYADALNDFDRFVDHVVWEINGTLDDLFHDTSVFPQTSALADLFGTGIWNGGAPQEAALGHKGLLVRPATLMGGGNNTSIILRGVMIRRRLLCDTLPTPNLDIVNARENSADPDALNHEVYSNRIVVRNLTASPTCMGCHALINPLAFALENFDSLGRFQDFEQVFNDSDDLVASHEINTVSYYPEIEAGATNALMNADDLALALTTSSKLKSCFATQLHRFQRFKLVEQSDHCGLNATESFIASGEGSILDVLIMNVANEDIFWRGN